MGGVLPGIHLESDCRYYADYLIWTRGSEDDYNRYAEVSGDEGWSFANMMNYFKKVSLVAHRDSCDQVE